MGRNILKLEMSAFNEYAEKLDKLSADLKPIFTDAMTQTAETIRDDTVEAMKNEHLPAHGDYSHGDTKKSIIQHPKVEWSGTRAEVGVGFDFGKPGAGGLLITGTPKMRPDQELNRIYKGKRYMRQIQKDMAEIFQDAIDDHMGG
mgnify:CR=1 FL=1